MGVVESTVLVGTGGGGCGGFVVSVIKSTVFVGTGGSSLCSLVVSVVKSTILVGCWPCVGDGDCRGWRLGVCLCFWKCSSIAGRDE